MLLLGMAAAVAMTSCSKDATTSVNTGEGIAFRSAMGTRAVETTIDNLSAFKVTALTDQNAPYFTDVLFSKSNGTTFTSDPAYHWPATGSLSFYAYAPSSLTGATITGDSKTLAVTPAAEVKNQVDFITANATGNKTDNEGSGVELTFAHRLSQIQVKAKNTNTAYVFKVKGVKIGSVESTGTFDFASQAFTSPLSGTKADYMIKYGTEHTLAADAVNIMDQSGSSDNGCAMLIPQQLTKWDPSSDGTNAGKNAYLSVLVNICTEGGAQIYPAVAGAYGWTAVGIDTNWEPGKRYVYTLDFSQGSGNVDPEGPDGGDTELDPDPDPDDDRKPGEEIFGGAIKFNVSVTEWQDAPQGDITM